VTDRQREFCIQFVRSRNTVEAALAAGYSRSYAKSRGYELLKIPEIMTEVSRLEADFYRETFKELAFKGLHAIGEIIESSEKPSARLRASELVLKQAGFIDPEKVDQEFTIVVKLPEGLKNDR